MLAAAGHGEFVRLGALHGRVLGVYGCRVDVGERRALWGGCVPLRTLDFDHPRLVLGAGSGMGPRVGFLAYGPGLHRMGPASAGGALECGPRNRFVGGCAIGHRPPLLPVLLGAAVWRSAASVGGDSGEPQCVDINYHRERYGDPSA